MFWSTWCWAWSEAKKTVGHQDGARLLRRIQIALAVSLSASTRTMASSDGELVGGDAGDHARLWMVTRPGTPSPRFGNDSRAPQSIRPGRIALQGTASDTAR